jgi:hypothetical protein
MGLTSSNCRGQLVHEAAQVMCASPDDNVQPGRQGARCCYSVPTANKPHVMIDPCLCLVDALW